MCTINKLSNFVIILFLPILLFCCKKEEPKDIEPSKESAVGSSANAFLSDVYFKKVVFEILYMPGNAPSQGSKDNLNSFLLSHLNKPFGIDIVEHEINSSGQSSYSTEDIRNLEKQYRENYSNDKTIAACMIFVDGKYSANDNVLGIAYNNTSTAIFGKTISENSGGISQPSKVKLESTVMNHEFGHLLGLVDIGSPMVNDHNDANHPSHCDNNQCLMYYASQTTEIASFLLNNAIPELDQNCKDDLIANGGK